MNWYKKAQNLKQCDRVLLTPNPQFARTLEGQEPTEYFYLGEDATNYYVKDSCSFGDGKHNSWHKSKQFYSIQKI
jgi:hypothetical protein